MLTLIRCLTLCALTLSLCIAQNFRVLKAEYGAERNWTDVTDRVQNLVRGDGVEFRVDGETLTDPMPGVQKNLRVRYVWNGRTRTDNFKDLDYVKLGNPSQGYGNNNGRGYGRGNGAGYGSGYGGSGLRVLSARYGDGTRWKDVTSILNDQIRNDRMRMRVTNDVMGGDPAPAVAKRLEVDFTYGGRRQTMTFNENDFADLPSGTSGGYSGGNNNIFQGGTGLIIERATWGVSGRSSDVTNDVQSRVQNDRLNLKASNSSFKSGDPAVGADKVLEVRYRIGNGQSQTVRANEGGYINIP